jgi:Ca2+-binding RTX toxin-like protein
VTRRAQGIVVALAVIVGIALASGSVMVLAGSGHGGTAKTAGKTLVGTNGPNRLIGTAFHDEIEGRGASDLIRGRRGADLMKGGRGRDKVVGGKGLDHFFGGGGGDTIRARDHHPDTIECGPGGDVAIVDRVEDGVYDCEQLHIPKPSQARPGR